MSLIFQTCYPKIVTSLRDTALLTKGICKTIKNEAKYQKDRFLGMLLGTLGASFLGNLLIGKRMKRSKILLSET